jgi:ribosomal protein S12 methylthiotransferase
LRLLYLNPERLTKQLLELISKESRICKYLDLPLQHINPRILGLMNRASSKDTILRLIEKIRKTIPGAAIRTTFIVGFPSETAPDTAWYSTSTPSSSASSCSSL